MSIELRQIREEEYATARMLWDIVFPDDAHGYSAYYFAKRTCPNCIFAAFDGQKMVAPLHAIPYTLRFGQTVKPCAMVAGVATLPEYRHQGIAGSLIRFAHKKLRQDGVVAAILKPDVDFYAQFGYLPFAYHNVYEWSHEQAFSAEKSFLQEPTAERMLQVYNAFAESFTGMMKRTAHDMALYLEETELSGFAVTDGCSYALCAHSDGGVEAAELVGENPLPLLAALTERYERIRFRLPASMHLTGIQPEFRMMFSMLCPLDEQALLYGTGASSIKTLLDGEIGPCCTLEFC